MTATLEKVEATETASPPVAKVRIGLVTASIWERVTPKGKFHTVSFERRYMTRDRQWATAHTYDAPDLLTLSKVADLAHTKLLELQNGDGE